MFEYLSLLHELGYHPIFSRRERAASPIARLDDFGVIEAEGGERHPAFRSVHPALPSACGTGVCRASSTSSTGMLLRTG